MKNLINKGNYFREVTLEMNAIELFDLTKRFEDFTAVDNLNLEVKEGEIFGLLGPNGAGKSTTISMLCTILKPSSGTAKISGLDIIKNPKKVRKCIGIVFQDPSIDDKLTGRENLELHANLYNVPRDVMHSRIDEVLKLVELEDKASNYVKTYSGGMRRRLEIARGLIHHPKVLFLDEPTIGLDPQSREHIWSYIKDLKKMKNITILLTTHYMEEADKLCDRIAIMDQSKIIALDTPINLKKCLNSGSIIMNTDNNELFVSKIADTGLVNKIIDIGGTLNLSVENPHTTLPRIVELGVSNGIYIESISILEPDMDDVFIHYTGSDIREGDVEFTGISAKKRRQMK